MPTVKEICMLVEDVKRLINDNITPEGECNFDPLKVKLALEFTKLEIEKSIAQESGRMN